VRTIPHTKRPYKRTALFTEDTVPEGLKKDHATKEDVWAKINVVQGRLLYEVTDHGVSYELDVDMVGVIEPTVRHRVTPLGTVKFFVEFYK
jgi:tellurite methyltransferase